MNEKIDELQHATQQREAIDEEVQKQSRRTKKITKSKHTTQYHYDVTHYISQGSANERAALCVVHHL